MRTFTKEQFWEECLANCPTLQRADFEQRWNNLWALAHLFGAAIDTRVYR